jgi:hypothetical protein
MKFVFNEFKKIINNLKKYKLRYFVFGGFCYYGLGENWKAKDLDLVCFEEDMQVLDEIFLKTGYSKKIDKRKIIYYKKNFIVDIRLIRIVDNIYQVRSNRTIDYLSQGAFKYKNYGEINGFKFRIVPNEFLLLYRKAHSENFPDKNKKLNQILDKIEPKCKKMVVCKQKRFRKYNDKFSPRMIR